MTPWSRPLVVTALSPKLCNSPQVWFPHHCRHSWADQLDAQDCEPPRSYSQFQDRSENPKSKTEPWKVQFWVRLVRYLNISNRPRLENITTQFFFLLLYILQLAIPGFPLPVSKNTVLRNNRMIGIDKVRIRQNCVWVSEKHKLLIIFKSLLLKGFFLWWKLVIPDPSFPLPPHSGIKSNHF